MKRAKYNSALSGISFCRLKRQNFGALKKVSQVAAYVWFDKYRMTASKH